MEQTEILLEKNKVIQESFNLMDEINRKSEDDRNESNKTFEVLNDFDGRYIKRRSSTDINPKPIVDNVKLNDEIVKD